MGEGAIIGGIARQAFGRINTSIAITMATYIAHFLSHLMPRAELILVSTVVFVVLVLFKRHAGRPVRACVPLIITPCTGQC